MDLTIVVKKKKKNELQPQALTEMNLTSKVLNEKDNSQRNTYKMMPFI